MFINRSRLRLRAGFIVSDHFSVSQNNYCLIFLLCERAPFLVRREWQLSHKYNTNILTTSTDKYIQSPHVVSSDQCLSVEVGFDSSDPDLLSDVALVYPKTMAADHSWLLHQCSPRLIHQNRFLFLAWIVVPWHVDIPRFLRSPVRCCNLNEIGSQHTCFKWSAQTKTKRNTWTKQYNFE